MDNNHRNFLDEGYNDEPVPRENIQLPSYSGDDNDNVDALVEKLRIYCKIKGISEVGKLDRIPFCLTGRAFTLFSGLSDAQKRNMGAITKALRDNFEKTPLPPSVAYQVLAQTKMLAEEKVQTFYERLMQKCKNQNVSKEILLSFFLGGLHKDLKSYCLLKNPTTIQEAVSLAREAEIVLHTNDGSIVSTQTEQQNEINQLRAQILTIMKNKEATVAAITPPQNPQPPQISAPTCQLCGRFNHSATECRNTAAIKSIFSGYFPDNRRPIPYNRPPPTYRPYYNNNQQRN